MNLRSQPWRGTALTWLARFGLSALFLGGIFMTVPVSEVGASLAKAAWLPVAVGMMLIIPKLVTAGLRMQDIAQAQDLGLRLRDLIAINLVTSFYSLFLPGLLAAGAMRWYKLAQSAGKPAAALAVIGFSRLIEIEVTLAIGLGFWLADPLSRSLYAWPALIMVAALVSCLIVHIKGPAIAGRLDTRLARTGDQRQDNRVRAAGSAVIGALARFRSLPITVQLRVIGYSGLTHLFGIATMVLFAQGLGIDASIESLGWVRSLMVVLLLLPISWAGVGVRELSLALLLLPYGVGTGEAVALGMLLSARAILEGAIGAVIETTGSFARIRSSSTLEAFKP